VCQQCANAKRPPVREGVFLSLLIYLYVLVAGARFELTTFRL